MEQNRLTQAEKKARLAQPITPVELQDKITQIESRISQKTDGLPEDKRLVKLDLAKLGWQRIQSKISKKTKNSDTLMEKSQWSHRKKIELARLHDLDQSIIEKYGHERGWKLSLRFD